ncbi:MAG: DEAD/DEAH box helicase [Proteobacteria bacterium]|nr:DEAD/DEAH box helicase [Pseudomonadota bacterium]
MENNTMEDIKKVASFDDFNLSDEVAQAIKKLGFVEPTPVQIQTYEKVLSGVDVIAMAQTGTGKTAAFGIPLAEKLNPDKKAVQGLVPAPTRELALQVCRELTAIGEIRGIISAAIYGGASFTKQVSEIRDGAQIVVGTPGRVLDHIRRGTISFSALEMLVLDEADEMLSMGFEKEISEIIDSLPKERQTMLFSATIPDDIRRLTVRYLDDAAIVSVSGDNIAAKEISHFVYLITGEGRPKDMVKVIEAERPESAIIFCNTRDETQVLAKFLQNAGYNADWLNSDLSQKEREHVMARTRSGKITFLVATDVAARGIDVSHLSHVMNYTFPESLEVYVHRTGRTGRMGRSGSAVSLIAPRDIGNLYYLRLTYKICPVEKMLASEGSEERDTELNRLHGLRKELTKPVDDAFSCLARRLLQDVHSERIVAGLLKHYFKKSKVVEDGGKKKKQPPATEVATEKMTKTKAPPAPVAAEPKDDGAKRGRPTLAPKKTRGSADTATSKTKPKAKPTAPAHEKTKKEESAKNEIYIDAGRKDGLRITPLVKQLVEATGIPRSAIGKVRMLTRSTFISVPQEHVKTVLAALQNIEVEGHKLKAEPAK